MTPTELAVWALYAAGIGRLIAQDSLLREARDRVLTGQLGVVRTPRHGKGDLADLCRAGIRPLEPDGHVAAATPAAAKLAEGLTCPSCMAWHAVVWTRLAIDRRGAGRAAWWRDSFAAWALASILTRKGG